MVKREKVRSLSVARIGRKKSKKKTSDDESRGFFFKKCGIPNMELLNAKRGILEKSTKIASMNNVDSSFYLL